MAAQLPAPPLQLSRLLKEPSSEEMLDITFLLFCFVCFVGSRGVVRKDLSQPEDLSSFSSTSLPCICGFYYSSMQTNRTIIFFSFLTTVLYRSCSVHRQNNDGSLNYTSRSRSARPYSSQMATRSPLFMASSESKPCEWASVSEMVSVPSFALSPHSHLSRDCDESFVM